MPLSYKHLTLQQIRDIALKEARRFLSQDDAEDIASTVMLELAGTDVRRTAFVAKRARWRVSDLMRQDKPIPLTDDAENWAWGAPDHNLSMVEGALDSGRRIAEGLSTDAITEKQVTILALRSEGFTAREVGQVVNHPAGHVRKLHHLARKALAKS